MLSEKRWNKPLNFQRKDLAFALVLIQMMIPTQIFIIPQYQMVSKLGLLNTTGGLVFPGIVTAFGTFLLRQAFMALPKDLEESSKLDGCNIFQTFYFMVCEFGILKCSIQLFLVYS